MNLNILPIELRDMILSYLEIPVVPTCKIIKYEIYIYNQDHNWYYSSQSNFYFVSNVMSFSEYYFDKMRDPDEYMSYHFKDRFMNK